jgi:site-specific DNA recombinase
MSRTEWPTNKAHAAWGRRAHRLEPDPATAPQVAWIFAQRLAGHSRARIARALNDAGVPCPSAAGPGRNPHRSGTAWTLHTVRAILGNPRYTGRQVWNRQRTDRDLVDPATTGLGHRPVQRWNLPEGWVISTRPAHPALVTEADFIAVQDLDARRRPGTPPGRCYQLAGLLRCGTCGRLMESCWSDGKAAYRCRHGHTTATRPDPARPPNAYIREDQIPPRLPALGSLIGAPARKNRKQEPASPAPAQAAGLISYLRAKDITLTYDPDQRTLRAGTRDPVSITIDRRTPTGRR